MNACDHGHQTENPVKVLPISDNGGNVIVCYKHYLEEMSSRKRKERQFGNVFDFPKWSELKEYNLE
jgi:hypothetical protein